MERTPADDGWGQTRGRDVRQDDHRARVRAIADRGGGRQVPTVKGLPAPRSAQRGVFLLFWLLVVVSIVAGVVMAVVLGDNSAAGF